MPPTVTLYSKHGCHLCDSVREEVLAARRAVQFEFVEHVLMETDALFDEFRESFPVVFLNGNKIAQWRLTRDDLITRIDAL